MSPGRWLVVATLAGSLALPASAGAAGIATWGPNRAGQLGDGHDAAEQLYSDVPVTVPAVGEAIAVAAGCEHDLALLGNGTVDAWGSNAQGQLGLGDTEARDTPTPVPGLSGVAAVAAGCNFSMALLANGEVRVWGEGPAGEASRSPVNPGGGLSEVVAIAAGDSCCHGSSAAYAVRADGTVESWGGAQDWQLGRPGQAEEEQPTPGPVEGVSGAREVAAGGGFAAARLADGAVVVWGANNYGMHGNGTSWTKDYGGCACSRGTAAEEGSLPTLVSGLGEVEALAASGQHILALQSSGQVRAWGANGAGELGDGTTEGPEACPVSGQQIPCAKVPVSVLPAATAISASRWGATAASATGALEAWGENEQGELGNGLAVGPQQFADGLSYSDVPVEVAGIHLGPARPALAARVAVGEGQPAVVHALSGWAVSGSLTDGEHPIALSGQSGSGYAALHGQLEAPVPLLASTQALGVSGLGLRLTELGPLEGTITATPTGELVKATARYEVEVTSVTVFGLSLALWSPCRSAAALTLPLEASESLEEAARRLHFTGQANVPGIECAGGRREELAASLLPLQFPSAQASFELTLESRT